MKRFILSLGMGLLLSPHVSGLAFGQTESACEAEALMHQLNIQPGMDFTQADQRMHAQGWQDKEYCISPSECIATSDVCGTAMGAHCQSFYIRNHREIIIDYLRDTNQVHSLTCPPPLPQE